MVDKGRLTAVLAVIVGLTVFSFAWSSALYLMLGFGLDAIRPWSVYQYIYAYGVSASGANVIGTSFLIAAMLGAVGAGAMWIMRPKHYYGDARWAFSSEIRHANLMDGGGILIGKRGPAFLRNDEPGHVLVAAPTRSGKGVGIVIPNLLSWPGSVVVLDIKHENHEITSGFRGKHQRVFKWSPMDDEGESHCFNPLAMVRQDIGHRISDVQRLAAILLPQPPHADPMWQNEARDLFLGIALFVMDDPDVPSSIGEIYRTLKSDVDLAGVAEFVINEHGDDLDPSCRMSLSNFMHKAPKERSGVKSNLTASLNLWANPVIDAATAKSDFSIEDLRRKPTSIYIGVKQNQLKTMAPLIGWFFQQCVDILGRDLPAPEEKHEVLLMIDEFASLGHMEIIENALAFLAGYKIRLVLIVQGLGQLHDLYDKGAENILQNCAVQVYFAANDETTAVYVSKRLGTKTISVRSRSDPGGFNWSTKTTSHSARDLMLPEQVRQLKDTKEIVFKENTRPVKADKIRYYADKVFKSRLFPKTSVPKLEIVPIQPRVFELPKQQRRRRRFGDSMPDDEGFGYEAPEEAVRIDEDAEAADLVAMGAELAKLVEEENEGGSDELAAALSDFDAPDEEDSPATAESV